KAMSTHRIATREQWRAERLDLLEAEKDLTHRSDELARRRQELPWVKIDKDYRFDTDEGSASLADLFKGRSQLLVYHFMFGPEYSYRLQPAYTPPKGSGPNIGAQVTGTDPATYARERPGMSAFVLEDGNVYHSYSAFARGLDGLWGAYQWLDRAPKGRNEPTYWWRHHDKYENA